MKRIIRTVAMLVCCFTGRWDAHAQNDFDLKRAVKSIAVLNNPQLTYDYNLQLVNTKTGKPTDAVSGKLLKNGAEYVDSSSIAFVAVSGNYFCKADYDKKTLTVYNIALLQRKLDLKVEKPKDVLPPVDSLIGQIKGVSVDASGKDNYRLLCPKNEYTKLYFLVDKKNYELKQVVIEVIEREQGQPDYKRIYTITNVSLSINQNVFDLKRIFSVNGNHVVAYGKYAQYKQRILIN